MNDQTELISLLEDSAWRFISRHQENPPDNPATTLWATMAELGWLGLNLPETHQGAGLGVAELTALTRIFGQTAFATRYIGQCVMPSRLLAATLPEHTKAQYLCEQLSLGAKSLAVAWQQQAGDMSPEKTSTELTEEGNNRFSLNGSKCFVAGADKAHYLLVNAQCAGELVIVMIETSAQGVAVNTHFDSQGGFADVQFNQVTINEDAILLKAEKAQQALTDMLLTAQIALAAELEGLATGCLEKTLEHIKTRQQFNQPIGAFQAIRHRSVDMLMSTRLAESSWRRAISRHRPNNFSETAQYSVHAAKARCADTAIAVAKEGVQMHGAMGFMEETGIGRFLRGAIEGSAWLGSSRYHRQQLMHGIDQGVAHV